MRIQVVLLAVVCLFLVGCNQVNMDQVRGEIETKTQGVREQAQEKIAETKEVATEKLHDLQERAQVTLEQLKQYAKEEKVTEEGLTCFQKKNLTMYGAVATCPLSQKQQQILGEEFVYVDCNEKRADCLAAGVQNMPTWIANDGTKLEGVHTLEELEAEFCD